MEFVFVVLATGPFLEHHYFGLTEIYCQGPWPAAVGLPWGVTEAPDYQQKVDI